ncbi:MAG: hypothetical protein HY744_02815 [Deltaproteobacteria bacterium]|nr:hypothetical protein [Deltaproteobacteria bacterium]
MTTHFQSTDLYGELPAPGYYPGTISSARWRNSESGHRMLQLLYAMRTVTPAYGCVAEYFVLEAATERGAAMARRRLAEVYRACGLDPQPGDSISPTQLVGSRLLLRLEHDEYRGQPRLRVVGHRRPEPEPELEPERNVEG